MNNGDMGTLTFVYDVDGSTIVDYDRTDLKTLRDAGDLTNPVIVFVGMQAVQYLSDGFGGTNDTLVMNDTRVAVAKANLLDSSMVSNGSGPSNLFQHNLRFSFDVPFKYGEAFGLKTLLNVFVSPDPTFQGTLHNPFFELWGSRFLDEVNSDFLNTAELVAIVNPDAPNAAITGASFDYSALVSAEAPSAVPVPASIWFFLSAVGVLARRRACANKSKTH